MTAHPHSWTLDHTRPPEWDDLMREFDGGFFQDPNALECSEHPGEPILASLHSGSRVDGIAVGLRYRCRLSAKARHAYFPCLPRLRAGVDRDAALAQLGNTLSALGVSDITFDSFDATGTHWSPQWGSPGAARNEYRVLLLPGIDGLRHTLSSNHARHVRRGEREGWRLQAAPVDAAGPTLALVAESATTRAAARGNSFAAATWDLARLARLCGERWGLTLYAAYIGDTLLSAALIGYGGARAFYLAGGSTDEGYARGAAIWMHVNTMLALRERGVAVYNLGGVPASAERPSHPQKGLHRFKAGFGSEIVRLNGVRWTDSSLHTGLHRAAQRLAHPSAGGYAA